MVLTVIQKRWSWILVAIAITAIFIPLIFTHSDLGKPHLSLSTSIPDAPKMMSFPKEAQSALNEMAQLNQQSSADFTMNSNIQGEKFIAKPVAFVIQVASLTDNASANALMLRLQQHGYNAYIQTISKSNTLLYRVLIGPVINRNDAEQIAQQVQKFINTKVIINSYTSH